MTAEFFQLPAIGRDICCHRENPEVKSMSAEVLMHFLLFLVLVSICCGQNELIALAS